MREGEGLVSADMTPEDLDGHHALQLLLGYMSRLLLPGLVACFGWWWWRWRLLWLLRSLSPGLIETAITVVAVVVVPALALSLALIRVTGVSMALAMMKLVGMVVMLMVSLSLRLGLSLRLLLPLSRVLTAMSLSVMAKLKRLAKERE